HWRAARLLRRSRFRSASRRSPARSGLPRGAGVRRSTPASPTSTRSTAADTSRHGKNRHSSRRSCARRSSRCGSATNARRSLKIFGAGGTGAIGRPLIAELLVKGHVLVVLTRSPEKAHALVEQGVEPAI